MKYVLSFLAAALLIFSCSCPRKIIEVEHRVETHYVDSTVWHDSTIYHVIPIERYKDYTSLLDTLHMETAVATADAWVDTTANILKGSIENKNDSIKTVVKWKEKFVYKDTTIIKEVPVEVEVPKEIVKYPKLYWWSLGISIIMILYMILRVYLKLKFGKNI